MPTIGSNSKPAYVYDAGTDTWIPIGPGEHTHDYSASNHDHNATYIAKTLTTTTGDIIYASAANTPARLGIGSTSQVLTVSDGVPVWAAASSGGMTLLSTTTMSGTSTTVSGIDTSYNQLVIQILDFYPSSNADFYFRLNNNSTANAYRFVTQSGDSGSPYPATAPQWFFDENAFYANATQKNVDSNALMYIVLPNYADTSTNKAAIFFTNWTNAGDNNQAIFTHGYVTETAAVTSILFSNNGTSASAGTIKIWGVK